MAAVLFSGRGGPKPVVYDLVERLPVAERWSARDVLLFGTPAAEPHQAEGFYREASQGDGDSFLWSKGEAEVSLTFAEVQPRAAVVDLAPYKGVRAQSARVLLNGREVGQFSLNDTRHRYGFALPREAQVVGENRLRFVFAAAASPSAAGGNPDLRLLAAGFYSLVVGPAEDQGLQALLGRDAPRPFSATSTGGIPAFTQIGPSVVRYALRRPVAAELRFTPELHAAARTSAASASFRVLVETESRAERELWSGVVSPQDKPREMALRLPGETDEILRLSFHIGPVGGADRAAWGTWQAPRILGKGPADALESSALLPADDARARDLRASLAGANVLLVVLDAARAAQFGTYGYPRATTPEIDRIAADGVVFERAYTPAAYTLGAMSSVWTSQYPDRHHGDVSFSAGLPKDRLTLAELLSAQGIHTAGFVANTVAGGLNGFNRGFSFFQETWREVGSRGDVFRQAVHPWLAAQKDRRFFAYVHFREPHFPYDPEPPFDTAFGPEGPIAKATRRDSTWITDVNQGRRTFSNEEREHLVRLYDGNLAYADQEVGALRRALEANGLWDRTVVIVMADHGEALLEHGWIGHNVQLFEESVRVPLIVRFPQGQGPRGVRVKGLADLLGVAPTVADIFGALGKGGSDSHFQGRTLLPQMLGAPGQAAVLSRTVWDRPIYGLRDERYKFLYNTRTGEQSLYDLLNDPQEARDVLKDHGLRVAYYAQTLNHWVARVARKGEAGSRKETMTREQCENLKALGYLGAGEDCSRYAP